MTYDLANRMTSITRPNGTQRTIGYDAAGQTTNIVERTAAGERGLKRHYKTPEPVKILRPLKVLKK